MKRFFSLIAILTLFFGVAQAQTFLLKGKVVCESDGTPVVGAILEQRGGKNIAISTASGDFKLNGVKIGDTFDVRSVGFDNYSFEVKNSDFVNVALKTKTIPLEQVVVTGFGVKKGKKTEPRVSEVLKMVKNESRIKMSKESESHINIREDIVYEDLASLSSVSTWDNSNDESYKHQVANDFKDPNSEPLSTFSIDIDNASYTNMRRMVNKGYVVTADAVRGEEFINFFKYNYPKPTGDDIVSITTEVASCPWNEDNRLVRIGLRAKEPNKSELVGSNLVLLIDVSGSMGIDNKLPLVQSSIDILVKNMTEKDIVSIVTYAGNAGVALPPTRGNYKRKIMDVVNQLYAGGSTAGADGIKTAYELAARNFIKGGNNRVMMFTDGDFNVGQSSDSDMETLIEKQRKTGVFLSVLGYGMGNYKDSKMQSLAQKGNGTAYYIDNMDEALRVLESEFAGTMFTLAKDVKLQVEFNPRFVKGYRLIGYESRMLAARDFNDDTKDAGEMGMGHTVTALYQVIPVGAKSNVAGSVDELKYQKKKEVVNPNLVNSNELLTVKMRYKEPDGDVSKLFSTILIDKEAKFSDMGDDFRFAAAVAAYAMWLQKSDYIGKYTKEDIIDVATNAKGVDSDGYRSEFVRLIKAAKRE